MSAQLIVLIALFSQMFGAPALNGLATWYDHGTVTRSGEPFVWSAPTCAVDASLWDMLAGRTVLVLSENGQVTTWRVNDSGHLSEAGGFRRRSPGPGYGATDLGDPSALRVVLDVPRDTFRMISPDGETIRVWVWVR